MSQYLLDTNIIILHVAGEEPVLFEAGLPAVSTVSVFELLCYPGMPPLEETKIRLLLSASELLPLTESIAHRAAVIARTHKVKAFDLLIAATAIEHNLTLITKNIRDFRKIPGLVVKTTIS